MSARGDFLNYALSLMRSHNDEHSDVLPVLDVCSLKHVAYVFQALIYWIKAMNLQTTLDTTQMDRKRLDALNVLDYTLVTGLHKVTLSL